MSNLSLVELDCQNGVYLTDKQHDHNYLEAYDILFAPFRSKQINIFEVGYWYGGSCELWKLYFPNAFIKSIDVTIPLPRANKRNLPYNLLAEFIPPRDRVQLKIKNVKALNAEYFKDFPPDIAIDDGSHEISDQVYFVNTVYPVLRKGGLLIVEDIQNVRMDVPKFKQLKIPFEVVDMRAKSGVGDSVFLLYRK